MSVIKRVAWRLWFASAALAAAAVWATVPERRWLVQALGIIVDVVRTFGRV